MRKAEKRPKLDADPECLMLCDYAAQHIRAAGFMLLATSMQSEACYYGLPGYHGLLRIAAHRRSRTEDRSTGQPVLCSITFHEKSAGASEAKADSVIISAIGRYIFRQPGRIFTFPFK